MSETRTTIGYNASATGDNSTAIGHNASTTVDNECVIGDSNIVRIIPGVNNACDLGSSSARFNSSYVDRAFIGTNDGGVQQVTGPNGGFGSASNLLLTTSNNTAGIHIGALPGFTTTGVFPSSDGGINIPLCGTPQRRWSAVYAINGTIQTSDVSEKHNINTSDLGIDFINRLKPISYEWNNQSNGVHYGLIAQDVKQVLTDISKNDDDFAGYFCGTGNALCGLNYSEFISPIIKSIQEITNVKTEEIRSPTNTYTCTINDCTILFDVDVSVIITLPDNVLFKGREITIIFAVRTASETLTINCLGSDTINGTITTSVSINNLHEKIKLLAGGNGVWYTI